ncbi:MAG TPA: hypothetical protein VIR33_12480 [Thermopolyspora sp.]
MLLSLATRSDLVARLGRDLTDAEDLRIDALLSDASALVRRYTGQDFTQSVDDVLTIRAQGGMIRLPQRPVIAVASVVAIGGNGAPDLTLTDWWWDGIDLIRIGAGEYVINLPEQWWDDQDGYPGTFRVTYSHGYAVPPPDVVAVVCGMATRTLTAPAMVGGVTSETVGPYSYRSDTPGLGLAVVMTDTDRQMLAGYRRKTGMISVRVG